MYRMGWYYWNNLWQRLFKSDNQVEYYICIVSTGKNERKKPTGKNERKKPTGKNDQKKPTRKNEGVITHRFFEPEKPARKIEQSNIKLNQSLPIIYRELLNVISETTIVQYTWLYLSAIIIDIESKKSRGQA